MPENENTALTDSRLSRSSDLKLAAVSLLNKAAELDAAVLDELDIDSPYARDLVRAYELSVQGRKSAHQAHATLFKVVKA